MSRIRHKVNFEAEFNWSKFSCQNKFKELSLPYYLPKTNWKIIEFIPFPSDNRYVKCEQPRPRFELVAAVSISSECNHWTNSASLYVYIYIYIYVCVCVFTNPST